MGTLKTAALFLFAWDFADEGIDTVLDRVCDLGISRIYPASSYHAGYFVHPHNPNRFAHLLEDGVAYFHPRAELYESCSLKPKVAQLCANEDWFRSGCEAAIARGLEVGAWNLCLHNTRLGLLHPECTVENALGDCYPHALTPSHPDVQAYLRAIVADLASHHPLASIFLEAVNYRGRQHGHHHARDGVHLGDLESKLVDISFHASDMQRAASTGIDVEGLRQTIAEHLRCHLQAAPDIDTSLPRTIEEFTAAAPALPEYLRVLEEAETSLLAELKQIALSRRVRLEGVGNSPDWDTVLVGAYGETPDRVAAITRDSLSKLHPNQELMVLIRIGFNGPGMGSPLLSAEDTCAVVQAAAENGAHAVGFYNYSEATLKSVQWIKPALASVGFGRAT